MNFKILMNVKRATFPSEKKNHKFLFFSLHSSSRSIKTFLNIGYTIMKKKKKKKKIYKKKEKMVPTTFETELIKKVINVKNIK